MALLLPTRPTDEPALAFLARHPEVLDALIAHHNAHARLEVAIVQAGGGTRRGVVQAAATGAVVKIELAPPAG